MIEKVFLGKAWHWVLLVLTSVLFWYCGTERLHVIEFNLFVVAMLVGTVIVVGAILMLHRPGEQITRDVLVSADNHESQSSSARE